MTSKTLQRGDITSRILANSNDACSTPETVDNMMCSLHTACDYGLEGTVVLAVRLLN